MMLSMEDIECIKDNMKLFWIAEFFPTSNGHFFRFRWVRVS